MSRNEEHSRAYRFIANWQFKTPETRKIMTDIVLQLRQGSDVEKVAAEELNDLLEYQGHLEASKSAWYFLKAVETTQGRKAARLPPKPRGKKYSAKSVNDTDSIFQVMAAREFKLAADEDVLQAARETFGEDRDDRTLNALVSELLPRVQGQTKLFKSIYGGDINPWTLFEKISNR